MRMPKPALRAAGLLCLIFLITGCDDSKRGGSGSTGSGEAEPSAASQCLRQIPSLHVQEFASVGDAVEAFAEAKVDCHANRAELRSRAAEMQRSGLTVGGSER